MVGIPVLGFRNAGNFGGCGRSGAGNDARQQGLSGPPVQGSEAEEEHAEDGTFLVPELLAGASTPAPLPALTSLAAITAAPNDTSPKRRRGDDVPRSALQARVRSLRVGAISSTACRINPRSAA